jgi:hypothetical protein
MRPQTNHRYGVLLDSAAQKIDKVLAVNANNGAVGTFTKFFEILTDGLVNVSLKIGANTVVIPVKHHLLMGDCAGEITQINNPSGSEERTFTLVIS